MMGLEEARVAIEEALKYRIDEALYRMQDEEDLERLNRLDSRARKLRAWLQNPAKWLSRS